MSIKTSLVMAKSFFWRLKSCRAGIRPCLELAQQFIDNWWMGQVVFCEGGAHDPKVNTLFQVSSVDDGLITWVNADEVTHVVRSMDRRSRLEVA
jgi:hypothetical protein